MSTLGERIRLARGGSSQEAFSRALNISKGSLGFYERNENLPNADVILKICSKAGIGLEWLLTGKGKMYKTEDPQPESASVLQESHKSADFDLFSTPGDSHEDTGESSGLPETADVSDDMPDCIPDCEDDSHTSGRQRKAVRIIVFYDNGTFEEFSR